VRQILTLRMTADPAGRTVLLRERRGEQSTGCPHCRSISPISSSQRQVEHRAGLLTEVVLQEQGGRRSCDRRTNDGQPRERGEGDLKVSSRLLSSRLLSAVVGRGSPALLTLGSTVALLLTMLTVLLLSLRSTVRRLLGTAS
jgi:hypothetical protein